MNRLSCWGTWVGVSVTMDGLNQTIKVLSANVRGLGNYKKLFDVLNFLNNTNPNIICLQDTHLLDKNYHDISLLFQGEIFLHGFRSNARGIAILFKNNFDVLIETVDKSQDNILTVDFKTNNIKIRLIVIYAPNNDSPEFYDRIEQKIEDNPQDYIIICGDFNLVLDPDLDSDNYDHINNPNARNKIIDILQTHNLVDAYRQFNPKTRHYTWRRKKPRKQARLDYFITSNTMCDIINSCNIKPAYKSDHSIIELNLIISPFLRYKGRWHFNVSLLKNPDYLNLINKAIDHEQSKYITNDVTETDDFVKSPDIVLEMILMRCRMETMNFARKLKNLEQKREKNLLSTIEKLEKSATSSLELDQVKQELEEIREKNLQGHLIRARQQYLQEYEKPSTYFLSLEKHKYVEKTIKKLVKQNGEILLDQKMILNDIKNYYEDLFRNHDNDKNLEKFDEIFADLDTKKLNPEQSAFLDLPISENEIGETLKKMKNHKTAGIDGFSAEFYKVFWFRLKGIISKAFNHAFKIGTLSVTLRHSIIICLPKGNKPRQFLKNWRPLSMLSVLYKLISGTFANRLKKILDTVISNTQSAFIKNRFIGDNTRLIYDIMNTTEDKKIPGLLVSIDFEKAFDSLSWKFLYKTLKYFNFGDTFISWIKILNKNIYGSILQCGLFSEKFQILRGCRQGDPISAYLFLLAAEILHQMIKKNPNIKGIKIDGYEIKMAQFADDTTLLLDSSPLSLKTALNTIEIFGSLSGLKMNSEKTKVIWLGSKKYSRDKIETIHNLQWGCLDFDLLGIKFNVNLHKMIEINLNSAIVQIKNQIINWNKRNITPIGKIVVIKSLFLAKINHILSILPIPNKKFITDLQKIFFQFLWSNKPDKIKRKTITQPIISGGLNMPDLNMTFCSIKAAWFRRLIKSNDQDWIKIFEKTICDRKNLTIFGPDYLLKLKNNCKNPFWQDVFDSFYKISTSIRPKSFQDVLDTPIWYNKKIFGTDLHYKNWSQAHIIFIRDIIDENDQILDFDTLTNKAKINILEYHNVKIFLGKYIKSFDLDMQYHNSLPTIPFNLQILFKSKKGNFDFTKVLNKNDNRNTITAIIKWHEKLNFALNSKTWQLIFKLNFTTINDNYFIYFNYRIFHRILGTNYLMHKMKISENELCRLCTEEPESLSHLFFYCQKSRTFWESIFDWIRATTGVSIAMDRITILFGYLLNTSYSKAINTILMIAKNYIFQMARSKSQLLMCIFKKKLLRIYYDQKYLAQVNDSIKNFQKVWLKFQPLISNIENQ